jgi:phage-related protein (TIGR01555 family)
MSNNRISKVLEQGGAIWKGLRLVRDNWQNVFTGLGTSRDKTVFGSFVRLAEISESELTSLYHQNDTARKVVALKPQEMMRQGFAVNIEDDTEAASATMDDLRRLGAGLKVRDGMIWGRLYGGCAIIIGADDQGGSEEELNENAIRSVKFLQVVDKRYLMPETYYDDPLNDEHFGEPETYRIVTRRGSTDMVVHRSRLLIFGGTHTSDEERDRLGGWDHSVLAPVYDVIRMFDSVWKSGEHLMSDASQAVFKIQGLMAMLAGGQKDVLQTRMQLVDMSRSVARALLLDADAGEEFSREPSSFTDAATMLDKFMMRLSSAVDIPVTILMGRSPAGQNATGESDFRWFYDTVRTSQENELKPQLERLVRILMLATDGPTKGKEPEGWSIKFAPLWQNTPSEQAELEKKTAEKDAIYINAQVLLPEEVALSRYRTEGWSAETTIDRDLREGMVEAEKKTLDEPVESVEDKPTDEPESTEAVTGKVVLAPTDQKVITRVNEGRASSGLPPLSEAEGGNMFISEFEAMLAAKGEAVGAAEGEVEAEEIKPESDEPDMPPAMQAQQSAPFGAPAFEPENEPENEPDDETE